MYYYLKEELNERTPYEEMVVVCIESQAKEKDIILYETYYGDIKLGYVVKPIEEFYVIQNDMETFNGIQVIDLTKYYKDKERKTLKTKLIKRMKEQIEEDKMLENLKKHSSESETMRKLYAQFEALGGETLDAEVKD